MRILYYLIGITASLYAANSSADFQKVVIRVQDDFFDVYCNDGSREVATKTQLEKNAVCGSHSRIEEIFASKIPDYRYVLCKNLKWAVAKDSEIEAGAVCNHSKSDSDKPNEIPDWEEIFSFISLPGGAFTMGSSNKADNPEYSSKRHAGETYIENVVVDPFAITKTTITQEQYYLITKQRPSPFTSSSDCPEDWKRIPQGNNGFISFCPTLPVTNISLNDARKFCDILNTQDSRFIYSLPTEAEWEYAAKGNQQGPFPWEGGERNLPQHVWFGNNSDGRPHPVCSLPSNSFGLCDMLGNVWEWIDEVYIQDRSNLPKNNPFAGIPDNNDRNRPCIRGGAFDSGAFHVRPSMREGNPPDWSGPSIGFRIIRRSK